MEQSRINEKKLIKDNFLLSLVKSSQIQVFSKNMILN